MSIDYKGTTIKKIFYGSDKKPVKKAYKKNSSGGWTLVFSIGEETRLIIKWWDKAVTRTREVETQAHKNWTTELNKRKSHLSQVKKDYNKWKKNNPEPSKVNPAWTAWNKEDTKRSGWVDSAKKTYDDAVDHLNDLSKTWQGKIDAYDARVKSVNDKIDAYNKHHKNPPSKTIDVWVHNDDWDIWNNELERLEAQLTGLKSALTDAESLLSSAQRDFDTEKSRAWDEYYKRELDSPYYKHVLYYIEANNSDIEKGKKEKKDAESRISSANSDISSASSRISSAESDVSSAKRDVDNAQRNYDNAVAAGAPPSITGSLSAQLAAAKSRLSSAESRLSSAKSDKSSAESRKRSAEKDKAKAEKKISQAEDDKKSNEKEKSRLESEARGEADRKVQNTINSSGTTLNTLKGIVDRRQNQVNTVKQDIKNKEDEIKAKKKAEPPKEKKETQPNPEYGKWETKDAELKDAADKASSAWSSDEPSYRKAITDAEKAYDDYRPTVDTLQIAWANERTSYENWLFDNPAPDYDNPAWKTWHNNERSEYKKVTDAESSVTTWEGQEPKKTETQTYYTYDPYVKAYFSPTLQNPTNDSLSVKIIIYNGGEFSFTLNKNTQSYESHITRYEESQHAYANITLSGAISESKNNLLANQSWTSNDISFDPA